MATKLARSANGRRLGKSTFFVAALVFAWLTLLNLPGEARHQSRVHGWPLTYLERMTMPTPASASASATSHRIICCYVILAPPDIWSLTTDVQVFDAWKLAGNFVIAATITLVSAGLWQLWCRRFGSPLRFSMRTAALGMLAVSLVFGWFHYRIARWHAQERIASLFTAGGGSVGRKSRLPEWLQELSPEALRRAFDDVTSVRLGNPFGAVFEDGASEPAESTAATAELLPLLAQLTDLESLSLDGTGITDEGLRHIARLDRLKHLDLARTRVTDLGLRHLEKLTELESLNLDRAAVLGPGIEFLEPLVRLRTLSCSYSRLNDDAFYYLENLPALERVDLYDTCITVSGLTDFKERMPLALYIHSDLTSDNPFGPEPDPDAGTSSTVTSTKPFQPYPFP